MKESLQEVCADAQVNAQSNYIGQYTDFYANKDLGGFLINPDKDFKVKKNERYLINLFKYGYEKFENDRDEDNTLDAIHTETEWYVPNNQSQDTKEVKNPFVRDAYKIESVRRRATEKETTANDSDDDIFIVDAVPISPNTTRTFSDVLQFEKNDLANTFKLLAKRNFRWDLLGFNVGNTVVVNGTNYTVTAIEPSLLTLNYTASGNSQGQESFTITYPIVGVLWTNRTSEGLIFSENFLNADNFSNLRYSIKRNISDWFPYLATAGKFIPTKSIDNSYFKANGLARTQFLGEQQQIQENESVEIEDISNLKIINQNIIETTVVADFEKVKTLVDNMQVKNTDNSIGGFIRAVDQEGRVFKGYIQKLDYLWKYEELTLTLEERNESDFLEITFDGENLIINEVGYDVRVVSEKRYNIFNDFIQFFDENNIFLCNRMKYDKVRLNGVVYDSSDELAIALENL